jgi:hypothetical protein
MYLCQGLKPKKSIKYWDIKPNPKITNLNKFRIIITRLP